MYSRARQFLFYLFTPQDRMYLGDRKWSLFKNFLFRWHFWVGKDWKGDFFQICDRGQRGGVTNIFWFYQWLSGEILTFFAPKSFSVAQVNFVISGATRKLFRVKKVSISPQSHWWNQKIYLTLPLPSIANLKKITFLVFTTQNVIEKKKSWK